MMQCPVKIDKTRVSIKESGNLLIADMVADIDLRRFGPTADITLEGGSKLISFMLSLDTLILGIRRCWCCTMPPIQPAVKRFEWSCTRRALHSKRYGSILEKKSNSTPIIWH